MGDAVRDSFIHTHTHTYTSSKPPSTTFTFLQKKKIVANLRNLSRVLVLLMAWPFSPTSQQTSLCFTRLDRGRKETEVLFTEQSSMTVPYGNVCLLVCLSFSLSVCLKPWLLIHQCFSPPACTSVRSHASLGSEFPFSPPFPSINLSYFILPSLPSQVESTVWKMSWLYSSKERSENFFFPSKRVLQILLLTNTCWLLSLFLSAEEKYETGYHTRV